MEDNKQIEEVVCNKYEVSIQDIYSRDTSRNASTARALTWYILHYTKGWSVSKIARIYSRTERNVKYMMARMKNYIAYDKKTNRMYEEIKKGVK